MAGFTTDLFDAPLIPGLAYHEGIVTAGEESALIAGIDRQALSPFRFQSWLGKRLTISFDWRYNFDNGNFEPADPIPN